MSTPEEWTDADPASLPRTWGHPDSEDGGECAGCTREIERGEYCATCQERVNKMRVRR